MLDLALANLTSPMVLCFVLGLAAALARSELTVPEAFAKALSLYLLFAIGFKGGAGMAAESAEGGLGLTAAGTLGAGILLSAVLPIIAFAILRAISRLERVDAAAVAAHYGSISIVTFVAGSSLIDSRGLPGEGYMVAVAAVMEAPAIVTALVLANTGQGGRMGPVLREVALNGSIVLLLGAFAIGWVTGTEGLEQVKPLIVDPFAGVLCLFLLDMGLVAGRGLRTGARALSATVIGFGIVMPLIGASLALPFGLLLGLEPGGVALLMTLAASASYIAVPAAMRVALPEANPSIYLTLSLGVTFPFNLSIGLPLYLTVAEMLAGGG